MLSLPFLLVAPTLSFLLHHIYNVLLIRNAKLICNTLKRLLCLHERIDRSIEHNDLIAFLHEQNLIAVLDAEHPANATGIVI